MEKSPQKRYRPGKQWFFIGGIVILLFVFAIGFGLVLNKKNQKGVVRTSALDAPEVSAQGGDYPNPEYARKLEEQRQIEIDEARQSGTTYVSPVVGSPKPAPDLKIADETTEITAELPPPPQITVAQPQPQLQSQVNPVQLYADTRSQELMQAIQQELIQVASRQSPEAHSIQILPAARTTAKETVSKAVASVASTTTAMVKATPPFQVGDILYAVVEQYLNTDEPVPAFLATVVSGPLKGAKIIGQFTRVDDRMTLAFQRLVHNNKVWKFSGYAVDPETTSGALASGVDYHRLSRWGGLIVSSLLKGWASATEKSGQTVAISDGTVVSGVPDYSFVDELLIASGEVGTQLAEKASQNFDRAPTVHLEQGVPVGIVVLSVE